MNWWGKIIGSGIGLLGGPMGAIIGGYLGHKLGDLPSPPTDKQKVQLLYYAYFFSCAAKVAKADGKISEVEIEKVESLIRRMELSPTMETFAKNVFRKSKNSKRSVHQDYKECSKLICNNPSIAYSFMGGLFELATCQNKKSNRAQIQILLMGEDCFKMPKGTILSWYKGEYNFNLIESSPGDLNASYELLGLSTGAKFDEVKKAYRDKISKLHPDRLESKDLPNDLIVFAKEQVVRLNLAYKKIKKARDIK
jgi:DnaJ like chaperone protein